MPDRERGSSGSMSGSGEPASTPAPRSAGRMRPRQRSVYFSRPFRDHLARKAEQTSEPTIAEALRLLVKRWDEEGEPVLEEEDSSTGRGHEDDDAPGIKLEYLEPEPSFSVHLVEKVTPAHLMELRVRRWAVTGRSE